MVLILYQWQLRRWWLTTVETLRIHDTKWWWWMIVMMAAVNKQKRGFCLSYVCVWFPVKAKQIKANRSALYRNNRSYCFRFYELLSLIFPVTGGRWVHIEDVEQSIYFWQDCPFFLKDKRTLRTVVITTCIHLSVVLPEAPNADCQIGTFAANPRSRQTSGVVYMRYLLSQGVTPDRFFFINHPSWELLTLLFC